MRFSALCGTILSGPQAERLPASERRSGIRVRYAIRAMRLSDSESKSTFSTLLPSARHAYHKAPCWRVGLASLC